MKLLFGVHNHQPVGNFEHIFEEAYKKAYLPFVETLNEYPEFKITYHFTGPLLEFIRKRHPEFFELVKNQVKRGQAEIVVSGFYEPILAAIPERDRSLQIIKAKNFVRRYFGYIAKGLWVTERVFEHDILKSLARTGIQYITVDDYHFIKAGFDKKDLHGYYLTEYNRKKVAIFPIDETLRYLVPFHNLDDVFSYLKELEDNNQRAAILFDDGEKFGVWPDTYEWVYKKGWLKKFIEKVLETPWLETSTFYEFLEKERPLGLAYLPTASYFEMSEWSLPPQKAFEFRRFVEKLKKEKEWQNARNFVHGGHWKNFLVKYPEANRMHKKMLFLSTEASRIKEVDKRVRASLFIQKAQCNDAYWHGIFGGIYLPHLREAVYKNLLKAERILSKRIATIEDIDFDGFKEIYLRTPNFVYQITEKGGALKEFSSLLLGYNFQNTLTRRFEHYHKEFTENKENEETGVKTIHEIKKNLPENIKEHLVYDWHEKVSFIDHFLDSAITVEDLKKARYFDHGNFTLEPYELSMKKLSAVRNGVVGGHATRIEKSYRARKDGVKVVYQLKGPGHFNTDFVIELNFIMPSGPNGVYLLSRRKKPKLTETIDQKLNEIVLKDASGLELVIRSKDVKRAVVFPFYTVSQSEKGFDLTYQGHSIYLFYEFGKKAVHEYQVQVFIRGGKQNA